MAPDLLKKLESCGIGGNLLLWFESYLTGRLQRVALRSCLSSLLEIEASVPQGSILGPLLFLIFINEAPDNILWQFRIFTDDTMLIVNWKRYLKIIKQATTWPVKCKTESRRLSFVSYGIKLHNEWLKKKMDCLTSLTRAQFKCFISKKIKAKHIKVNPKYIFQQQCLHWMAFSWLFTHPNVNGPDFFRRVGRVVRPAKKVACSRLALCWLMHAPLRPFGKAWTLTLPWFTQPQMGTWIHARDGIVKDYVGAPNGSPHVCSPGSRRWHRNAMDQEQVKTI